MQEPLQCYCSLYHFCPRGWWIGVRTSQRRRSGIPPGRKSEPTWEVVRKVVANDKPLDLLLAPDLALGWATVLGWCSTRHRDRYGRKSGAVGYPYRGYRPRAWRQLSRFSPKRKAASQMLFHTPLKCITPECVASKRLRRHNPQFARGSRGCRPETRPDHAKKARRRSRLI